MINYNKLVRDGTSDVLRAQGYVLKGKILKDKQYTAELYSLFLRDFKDTFKADKRRAIIHYADMLEVIRTLMLKHKVDLKKLKADESQAVQWYKGFVAPEKRLKSARTDLLQKFYELLQIKTEAINDQLKDMFNSFKKVLDASKINFAQVERVRQAQFSKLGGFNKGIYLQGVSRVVGVTG